MAKIASIDIGTNSTRLLIAGNDIENNFQPLVMQERMTRLGQGVHSTKALAPDAMERVFSALDEYIKICRDLNVSDIQIIATSATRDASNKKYFVDEIALRTEIAPNILTGDEEALFTFLGAISDLELKGEYLVCDIGGGSTEFIVGEENRMVNRKSLDIGSLRLTENFIYNDPPVEEELRSLERFVHERLNELTGFYKSFSKAVFSGGTATTLAMIDGRFGLNEAQNVHKYKLRKSRLVQIIDSIKLLPTKDKEKIQGLLPERAPVILTGALIMNAIMDFYQLEEATISLRDLLFGILMDLSNQQVDK
jgi:exopolyphosphatase / guanosine-5'-triphosphate,3'-diphosphate pyrophosphatase